MGWRSAAGAREAQWAVLLTAALTVIAPPAKAQGCAGRGTALVVDTARHMMWRCERGRPVEEMAVALGSGGVGKRREGDAKVPLGDYELGPPRGSRRFHVFIPVGYPTRAQRRAGYTGGAVGVHGPMRGYELLGSAANTAIDWTLGCIALGSDEEIERVAAWVREKRVSRIVLD